jgi:hypothetical protein
MKTLNLSAIATSSFLTGIAILSLFAPADAGEVNLTCSTKQGSTTTIALNAGDSTSFGNWSVSDAIDVAYAVKKNCQDQGVVQANQINVAPAPKYSIKVNSVPSSSTLTVRKEIAPVEFPITAASEPSQSGSLW